MDGAIDPSMIGLRYMGLAVGRGWSLGCTVLAKRVGHGLREFQQSLRNRKEIEDRSGKSSYSFTAAMAASSLPTHRPSRNKEQGE